MPQGRILRDMGTHYTREVLHWQTGDPVPGRRQKINRFLCIGGPLAGVWRSSEELREEAPDQYSDYNAAGGRRGANKHSMVFIDHRYLHRLVVPLERNLEDRSSF